MEKFCKNCNYILDITKNIELKTVENIDEFIKELSINNINLKFNISKEDLQKNSNYKKLSSENKTLVDNNFDKFKNLNNIGFFKCNNCGYFTNIENETILITSNKSTKFSSDLYISLQAKNNILPRTRDYICPNTECKANNTNYKEREAVFYRDNNSYKLKYLCCNCNHEWSI